MRKKQHPQNSDAYYDIFDDWNLIEASFLKQYGIRLRTEDDMSYAEFCSLLSGIMPDTPLGQVVSIRAEKDMKVINNFTKEQKRIRNDWLLKRNQRLKKDRNAYMAYWQKIQLGLKAAFSR
ncbi:MAG: hypothetical protein HP021_07695 [Lachnospira sp.]|nr:hypothetical protein [Lachnospira sp.]